MSDNRSKSGVLMSLRGLKSILSSTKKNKQESADISEQSIPELNEEIPTLNESIPILDEQIEIEPLIKISLDKSETTETIEQQLSRTHYENPAESPELVEFSDADYLIDDALDEKIITEHKLELISDQTEPEEYQLDQDLLSAPNSEQNSEILEQQILDISWQKVESLLMDNLPSELAGTYLSLLNDKIDNNRLRILSDLSHLDESQMYELVNKLN